MINKKTLESIVTKTNKTRFLVIGYAQTGSGSLTFPEDFDVIGFVEDDKDAQKIANDINQALLDKHGIVMDEGDEEVQDALADVDEYFYECIEIPVIEPKR